MKVVLAIFFLFVARSLSFQGFDCNSEDAIGVFCNALDEESKNIQRKHVQELELTVCHVTDSDRTNRIDSLISLISYNFINRTVTLAKHSNSLMFNMSQSIANKDSLREVKTNRIDSLISLISYNFINRTVTLAKHSNSKDSLRLPKQENTFTNLWDSAFLIIAISLLVSCNQKFFSA